MAKNANILNILQKHPILKWLFFTATIIGAITTILGVPITIYKYYNHKSIISNHEYVQLSKINIDQSINYIKSILGEPIISQSCSKTDTQICPFPHLTKYQYSFEGKGYFAHIFTNTDNNVTGYILSAKTPDFHFSKEIFLGRFLGYKTITLGETTFSEIEQLNDGYISIINDAITGNRFNGFFQTIFSTDYAINHFLLLSTTESPTWSNFHTHSDCNFSLLNTYEYDNRDYPQLSDNQVTTNINQFTRKCSIQSLGFFKSNNISTKFYELKTPIDKEKYLNEELSYIYFL